MWVRIRIEYCTHISCGGGEKVPYSLNISRGKIYADFAVLGVTNENFILEIFRPPYSLIHFGSVCKSAKNIF